MRAVAELPIRKARWRSLVVYGVIFAVGIGGGAGLMCFLRPTSPDYYVHFEVQVDYFVSAHPIEGLRARFIEKANGENEAELFSEIESPFSVKSYRVLVNQFTFTNYLLIDYTAEGLRILGAQAQDELDAGLVRPKQPDLVAIDLSLETSGKTSHHAIQLGEREYRILPVKALPGGPMGENEGKQGYVVISTSWFRRTP